MDIKGSDRSDGGKAPTNQKAPESHFDKERARLSKTPFTTHFDKHDYNYSLENWGSYCHANRQLRREHYRPERYLSLDQIRSEALFTGTLNRSDGGKAEIILWKGKIEQLEIDVIVNAANETLLGGGGVDQAIHEGAGPMLVKECANRFPGGCEVGEAKLTKGYCLPANYVLHTVGPILDDNWQPDDGALRECYRNCLRSCEEHGLKSVAFPCISCGFYGFPVDRAARVVSDCLKDEVERHSRNVEVIVLSVFDEKQVDEYRKELEKFKK